MIVYVSKDPYILCVVYNELLWILIWSPNYYFDQQDTYSISVIRTLMFHIQSYY